MLGPAMARPGSMRQPGHRRLGAAVADGLELAPHQVGHLLAELAGVHGRVLGGVGDAVAAPEVELGQVDAVDPGHLGVQPDEPAGRDLEAGRVEDLAADVGVQPEQRQARLTAPTIRATASAAWPPASEKPNFWSSWAVAMNSWVCASTPTVTRTITGARTPSSAAIAATRSISSNESTTIRPTP